MRINTLGSQYIEIIEAEKKLDAEKTRLRSALITEMKAQKIKEVKTDKGKLQRIRNHYWQYDRSFTQKLQKIKEAEQEKGNAKRKIKEYLTLSNK